MSKMGSSYADLGEKGGVGIGQLSGSRRAGACRVAIQFLILGARVDFRKARSACAATRADLPGLQ